MANIERISAIDVIRYCAAISVSKGLRYNGLASGGHAGVMNCSQRLSTASKGSSR